MAQLKDFARVNSDESERLISVEVCDDPTEIDLVPAAVECQRCGSGERIAAMLRFPDLPDLGFLAVCGYCYRELTKWALGRVV